MLTLGDMRDRAAGEGGVTGVIPLSVMPVWGGEYIATLQDWSDLSLVSTHWPYVNLNILGLVTGAAVLSLAPLYLGRPSTRS